MQKHLSDHLKWLPNTITFSRAILACFVFIATLRHQWAAGLWLLLAALATDFLDGLAAKKLNAKSKFGEELDGLTDSLVVILGTLGLSIAGRLPWAITIFIIASGGLIGSDRIIKQPYWKWRIALAVTCLFLTNTGMVWMYATLAYGWAWWYVVVTIGVLTGCALLKKHRLKAWLAP